MSTQQAQWTTLVQGASVAVKQARQLDADWEPGTLEEADAALDAALDGAPEPPPDPPPAWHGPSSGFYARQHYGNGARQWGNLTIPNGTPKGVLVQVHGGGWMQGDPNVAIYRPSTASDPAVQVDIAYDQLLYSAGPMPKGFYGLRAMASYAATRWGVIVWEPAYQYATAANPASPDACLADVKAAIHWLYGRLNDWGALQLPVVYAGHSAGGQLSLRAALDPSIPAPKAWLGMAAAGLTVHSVADVQDAPGGFAPGGTGWIFTTAWGPVGTWPDHAPDTHLNQRPERFPLYVEQGNTNGHDDGSVNVKWARDFIARTNGVWPTTYHEQAGATHFSVRWDESAITRADMDAIWSTP
jgi:acetyl esterase/lipase